MTVELANRAVDIVIENSKIPKPYKVDVGRYGLCHDVWFKNINHETEMWLNEKIGHLNWSRKVQDEITFSFKHEEDKVKFILRWL